MSTSLGPDTVVPRRRWLAATVGLPALAWMGGARAQANPPVLIAWLGADTNSRATTWFHEGMAALGWKIGTHYVFEERHAQGLLERLPSLAQELAVKRPAVIVATPSSTVRAVITAAPTTPIVLAGGDPLATGLVTSLARPGGLVTGVSNASLAVNQKVIELMVEARPKLQRIGFLADSTSRAHATNVANVRRAADRLRVEAVIAEMTRPQDIEPAFMRLAKDKAQALVILASSWFAPHYPKILELALAQRWPVAGASGGIPMRGGLFSFSADYPALVRRTAYYVDRILKGTRPADLPIEEPTAFDLILNMKTAATLDIAIPQSIMLRATRLIE